ncbi:unnamed protein product [Paramecium octaurelia]|uniref:Uncharacterized protein n=1 Tax=Paramecium octaurelia TaxID=43137 RepID=A0A8S1U8C6_PAROT|nr:unnamed protein product [Paramecium octaurelia]
MKNKHEDLGSFINMSKNYQKQMMNQAAEYFHENMKVIQKNLQECDMKCIVGKLQNGTN